MSAARTSASLARTVWFGIVVSLLLVVGAGGWAATAQLASAVIAPGTLVLSGGVATVRAAVTGTAAEVLVREGDVVAAGDPLVRLAPPGDADDRAMLDQAIAGRKARIAAETALDDGSDTIAVPPGMEGDDPASRAALAEAQRTLAAGIEQRNAVDAAAKRQEAARNAQIETLKTLADKGDSAAAAGMAEAVTAAADEALARIREVAAERAERKKTIEALRADLGALSARRERLDREDAALVLRAPVAGTVFELAASRAGGTGARRRAGGDHRARRRSADGGSADRPAFGRRGASGAGGLRHARRVQHPHREAADGARRLRRPADEPRCAGRRRPTTPCESRSTRSRATRRSCAPGCPPRRSSPRGRRRRRPISSAR